MKKAASTTKRTTSKKPKTEGLGVIGELDRYLFGEGRHYQLYHKLAHTLIHIADRTATISRSGRRTQPPSAWSATSTPGIRMQPR